MTTENLKKKQVLLEIKKSYQQLNNNHNNSDIVSSKKRHQSEDETKRQNEQIINSYKRAKVVSLASLPQLESPASFNSLDDDCLGNVLDFVGKECYSAFVCINKRCNKMFCSKGYPKKTYWYGYAPLRLITQRRIGWYSGFAKAVLHYNRRDILDWLLRDGEPITRSRLKFVCCDVIKESRLDILREIFYRASARQLKYLRSSNNDSDLCYDAASIGNLKIFHFLWQNWCKYDKYTRMVAEENGHEHILQFMRNPYRWQSKN